MLLAFSAEVLLCRVTRPRDEGDASEWTTRVAPGRRLAKGWLVVRLRATYKPAFAAALVLFCLLPAIYLRFRLSISCFFSQRRLQL